MHTYIKNTFVALLMVTLLAPGFYFGIAPPKQAEAQMESIVGEIVATGVNVAMCMWGDDILSFFDDLFGGIGSILSGGGLDSLLGPNPDLASMYSVPVNETNIPLRGNVESTARTTESDLFKECILDPVAWMIKSILISVITQYMMDWIEEGFFNGPVFLRDPVLFARDLAHAALNSYLDESGVEDYLCEPYSAEIIHMVRSMADQPTYGPTGSASCVFSSAEEEANYVNMIENGNIDDGGIVEAMGLVFDNRSPYASLFNVQYETANKVGTVVAKEMYTVSQGDGYFSMRCTLEDNGVEGVCTPGQLVSKQIDDWLGGALGQLEVADEASEILNEAVSWLVTSIFGFEGDNVHGLLSGSTISEEDSSPLSGARTYNGSATNYSGGVDSTGDPMVCSGSFISDVLNAEAGLSADASNIPAVASRMQSCGHNVTACYINGIGYWDSIVYNGTRYDIMEIEQTPRQWHGPLPVTGPDAATCSAVPAGIGTTGGVTGTTGGYTTGTTPTGSCGTYVPNPYPEGTVIRVNWSGEYVAIDGVWYRKYVFPRLGPDYGERPLFEFSDGTWMQPNDSTNMQIFGTLGRKYQPGGPFGLTCNPDIPTMEVYADRVPGSPATPPPTIPGPAWVEVTVGAPSTNNDPTYNPGTIASWTSNNTTAGGDVVVGTWTSPIGGDTYSLLGNGNFVDSTTGDIYARHENEDVWSNVTTGEVAPMSGIDLGDLLGNIDISASDVITGLRITDAFGITNVGNLALGIAATANAVYHGAYIGPAQALDDAINTMLGRPSNYDILAESAMSPWTNPDTGETTVPTDWVDNGDGTYTDPDTGITYDPEYDIRSYVEEDVEYVWNGEYWQGPDGEEGAGPRGWDGETDIFGSIEETAREVVTAVGDFIGDVWDALTGRGGEGTEPGSDGTSGDFGDRESNPGGQGGV